MILKRNFNPLKIWSYIKKPMSFAILWAVSVWSLHRFSGLESLQINFTPVGVLGSALAIFIAFRNNSAYSRWWEARQIWTGIVNSSRVLARLIITFTDSHAHQENYLVERSEAFKKEMVYKCIAWAHTVRLSLRRENSWEELQSFFREDEFDSFLSAQNKASFLHLLMGKEIYKAMANGTLGGFDSFQMEGQLLALANYQGAAEKIKETPLPRQYDFFTRVFVTLFVLLLPFGLLSLLPAPSWLIILFSILISGVFIIMERTGAANEDPFENLITDVPMTTLCNTIERDLREMLGETSLPPAIVPKDGYLF
ncbi:MAG: bestrophin family ion channel [Bacteroidota bacterium]